MADTEISVIFPMVKPQIFKSRKRRSSNEPDAQTTPYGRTLKQYSPEDKLDIIDHAKQHGNRAAGREFNVAESSIREWRKNEQKLIRSRDANAGVKNGNATSVNNNINNSKKLRNDIRESEQMNVLRMWSFGLTNMPLHNLAHSMDIASSESKGSIGTPNSNSSLSSASTTPPSNSPSPSQLTGAGRRKIRAPQKILQEP